MLVSCFDAIHMPIHNDIGAMLLKGKRTKPCIGMNMHLMMNVI